MFRRCRSQGFTFNITVFPDVSCDLSVTFTSPLFAI